MLKSTLSRCLLQGIAPLEDSPRRFPGRTEVLCPPQAPSSPWVQRNESTARPSAVNQSLFPFVDQDVSDRRGALRFQLATRCVITRRQFLDFLPARRGGEQRLQFPLPFLKIFLRSHRTLYRVASAFQETGRTLDPQQSWKGFSLTAEALLQRLLHGRHVRLVD